MRLTYEQLTEALKMAEKMRREQMSKDIKGHVMVTGSTALFDYSTSGTFIDSAIHHLDEALPSKQKVRAEQAYAVLREATDRLGLWMAANGYEIDKAGI